MKLETVYIKRRRCGRSHFAVSTEHARAQVSSMLNYLDALDVEMRASFGTPSLAARMRCFRGGADSAVVLSASEAGVPVGASIQPVMVER